MPGGLLRELSRPIEPSPALVAWLTYRTAAGLVLWTVALTGLEEPAREGRAAVLFVATVLMPVMLVRLTAVRQVRLMRGFNLAFLGLEAVAALGLTWANTSPAGPAAAGYAVPYAYFLGGTAIVWSVAQLLLNRVRSVEAWAGVAATVGLMAGAMLIYLERTGRVSRTVPPEALVQFSAHGHVAAMVLPLIAGWLCGWTRARSPRVAVACFAVAMAASLIVPAWGVGPQTAAARPVVGAVWLVGMTLLVVPLLRLATALRRGPAAFGLAIGGIGWAAVVIVLLAEIVWRLAGGRADVFGVLATLHGSLATYVAAAASVFGLAASGRGRRPLARPRRLSDRRRPPTAV